MGIRTDLTSLGAIGLGTAVAVLGTGALLFANMPHHIDADVGVCLDVPTVTTLSAVPGVPAAPAAPSVVTEVAVDEVSDAPVVVEVADAPAKAPKVHRVDVVVADRIEVRTECVSELKERRVDVRVRALARADEARARADEARSAADAVRSLADEIRAEAEAIRAEAQANGEVDPDRIQELVEAALADAGIRRGGSWGN